EPRSDGFRRLTESIGDMTAAAIDGDEPSVDSGSAWLHARRGDRSDVAEAGEERLGLSEKSRSFFFAIQKIDDRCDIHCVLFLSGKNMRHCRGNESRLVTAHRGRGI